MGGRFARSLSFTRVYRETSGRAVASLMSYGSSYFLTPGDVVRTIGGFYHSSGRRIPRAINRVTTIVCGDLTGYCNSAVRRVRTLAKGGCAAVCIINNNTGTKCLGRLATGCAKGGISTKPSRTATVKGVIIRVLRSKIFGSLPRTEAYIKGSFSMGVCRGVWRMGVVASVVGVFAGVRRRGVAECRSTGRVCTGLKISASTTVAGYGRVPISLRY